MYFIFDLEIFVCSKSTLASSSLSHVSRLAMANAVNSGCLLKGLKAFSSWHPLAGNTMNSKFFIINSAFPFVYYSDFCSLCRQRFDWATSVFS